MMVIVICVSTNGQSFGQINEMNPRRPPCADDIDMMMPTRLFGAFIPSSDPSGEKGGSSL